MLFPYIMTRRNLTTVISNLSLLSLLLTSLLKKACK
jgi:hypothetical protein